MSVFPSIRINPAAQTRTEAIAADLYCVVVDDFLQRPHEIVDFACHNAAAFSVPEKSYPGLLLDVDDGATQDVYRFIRTKMARQFGFLRGGMTLSTFLSMATLQPDELSNLQRVCHVDPRDRPDRRNYAALVYLFENEDLGGTGFYRWKDRKLMEQATALELEDPQKSLAFLRQNFPTFREPPAYMAGSNEIAELLNIIPARFNRLIFYSGDVPHSAYITKPALLSNDFRKGRLTLNCFASVFPG